jgi:hypothetical protein
MEPDSLRHRLRSWRNVVDDSALSPHHRGTTGVTDELLEEHFRQLEGQCRQFLQARDRNFLAVQAYVSQPGRTPANQALAEDWAAVALKTFNQSSFNLWQLAIMRLMKAQREGAQPPVIIHTPPQPKPLLKRLLGS